MRVLHIINSLEIGGAEKLIVEILPLLSLQGLQVDLLLLNGKETDFFTKLKMYKNCRIFILGMTYYNPLYIFKIMPYLNKYDLIHVHLFPAQYFTVAAKILSFNKIPLVFSEHNTHNRRLEKTIFRFIEKFIYSFYLKIFCITDEVKKVLNTKLNISNEKLELLQNGININSINHAKKYSRVEFNYDKTDVLLIMVAAFRIQKDHDTVIRAMNLLPAKYKLLLVGDGERRKDLEALISVNNLGDRITFLGNRSDVYSLIKMSDIAILSSHWEGFGLAAAESMACNTPTIASNVPGLSQVVENGGLLFNKCDEFDLVNKIYSLENHDFYNEIAEKGFFKANKYDIKNTVKTQVELYRNIINKDLN